MPTYDYICKANQRIVEVRHPMSVKLSTWGELCQLAAIEPGQTPPDSPVERLITGGNVVRSGALKNPEPACGGGACSPPSPEFCCGGGACRMGEA